MTNTPAAEPSTPTTSYSVRPDDQPAIHRELHKHPAHDEATAGRHIVLGWESSESSNDALEWYAGAASLC
jgi:uncharacterized protein YcgI (DUF1989 family)